MGSIYRNLTIYEGSKKNSNKNIELLRTSSNEDRLSEDIILAEEIITGGLESHSLFGDISGIYRTTNERSQLYEPYFHGKKSMFSVIGSGDQILNATLAGVEKIEAFDISRFPKYFLALKIAAIKALNYEEFVTFFFHLMKLIDVDNHCYNLFLKMITFLEQDALYFWLKLLREFGWSKVYNSSLFCGGRVSLEKALERNKYLQSNNFYHLKRLVFNQKLQTYDGDLFNLVPNMKETDLAYLSNIVDYAKLEAYLNLLPELKLAKDGICVTSTFEFLDKLKKAGFECHSVDKYAGFMIYRC